MFDVWDGWHFALHVRLHIIGGWLNALGMDSGEVVHSAGRIGLEKTRIIFTIIAFEFQRDGPI